MLQVSRFFHGECNLSVADGREIEAQVALRASSGEVSFRVAFFVVLPATDDEL